MNNYSFSSTLFENKFGLIFMEINAQLLPAFLFPAFKTAIDEEANICENPASTVTFSYILYPNVKSNSVPR